ncbi:MAG: helix-turn-helix transcriptional regulator [Lentisphaeria bacterium]|nr:helix-turn-helix transcriptional regulator [Lentisphaeria bacterium]
MSQKILYNESRIFNRNLYDASRKGVQFYYWLDSVFYPGFVGKSSGGDLAMYQYVESGRMRCKSGEKEFISQGGVFYISLTRQRYNWVKCDSKIPVKRQCFSIYHSSFHDYLVREFFPELHIKIVLTDQERVADIMQRIKAEFSGSQAPEKLAALHMELLCELSRQNCKNAYPEQFSNILQYINKNIQSPQLGREDIAEYFNISIRSLSRMFQKYLSTSPARYIIGQRLVMAKGYPQVHELTIKEIAGLCGFKSVNFMIRQFRQHEGVTPGTYRQMIIKKDL